MPIDSGNLALKGLDDLFSTEENRQEEQREQVRQIPIDDLHPFTNHPFKVLDDEAMARTVESIAQYGVLAPLIARPRPDGDGYEIISGHRRQYAAKLAGLDTLPVIVRQMSDDAAVILMVDSNLQREHILPSERAFAYKMKLEALKNQGARSDLTSSQIGTKLRADEKVAQDSGESRNQVQRFIRLTNLIPELRSTLPWIDEGAKSRVEKARIALDKIIVQEMGESSKMRSRLTKLDAQLKEQMNRIIETRSDGLTFHYKAIDQVRAEGQQLVNQAMGGILQDSINEMGAKAVLKSGGNPLQNVLGSLGGLQSSIQTEWKKQEKDFQQFGKDVCSRVVTLEDSRKALVGNLK